MLYCLYIDTEEGRWWEGRDVCACASKMNVLPMTYVVPRIALYRPPLHLCRPLLRCIQLGLQNSQLFLPGQQPPLQLREANLGGCRSRLQL